MGAHGEPWGPEGRRLRMGRKQFVTVPLALRSLNRCTITNNLFEQEHRYKRDTPRDIPWSDIPPARRTVIRFSFILDQFFAPIIAFAYSVGMIISALRSEAEIINCREDGCRGEFFWET
jgi:hypothetical protein